MEKADTKKFLAIRREKKFFFLLVFDDSRIVDDERGEFRLTAAVNGKRLRCDGESMKVLSLSHGKYSGREWRHVLSLTGISPAPSMREQGNTNYGISLMSLNVNSTHKKYLWLIYDSICVKHLNQSSLMWMGSPISLIQKDFIHATAIASGICVRFKEQ